MKTNNLYLAIIFALIFITCGIAQNKQDPWTEKQLMQAADLAAILNNPQTKKPILYSIGFGGGIKGSTEMGAARDQVNLDKFKEEISKLPKDADIVIYCGCCPFVNCPNVRPAFNLMKEMKFTNYKLLNLSTNLKKDWIDKGYPMNEQK